MLPQLLKYRRVLIVALHLALIICANYLAFWFTFEGSIPTKQTLAWRQMLPWLVVIRGLTFIPFRLYGGLWRYTGIWDLRDIVLAVSSSTCLFAIVVYWGFQPTGYPRSVLVMDAMLLICLMGGIRLGRRLYRAIGHLERKKRVLIYGAGNAGEMIVRDMKNNPTHTYTPIGFIDDDVTKVGQRIHGVWVLGTCQRLPEIMVTQKPDEVLVAMRRPKPSAMRVMVEALEPFKVSIKTLPNLQDILDNKVAITQIRDLAVEDLLTRSPIGLDPEAVRHFIAGRRVLVTGAGGSIGSELCRQIAALHPGTLLLYERYENNLYAIGNDLMAQDNGLDFYCIVGDITDVQRVNALFEEYQPAIVFHAAAHKHVPLMEHNPCEAVKNNVLGTRIVAEAAVRYGAESFILISTDKAVNPVSVMGASKRVAEFVVRMMSQQSQTRFMAVRFGNVLGSNGSVVPHFLAQIKAGGPVTVTHPEVRRYFMLIPEAVHLVLHAAALGEGGTIYVLEMGEQIKVLEMARNLIRLAGYVPEEEIPITIVGLRPGEKLAEELVEAEESMYPSGMEKIFQVRVRDLPDRQWLAQQVAKLENLARQGQPKEVIECLCVLVPTFQPEYRTGEVGY